MRRILFGFLLILFCAVNAHAQSTTVSGTITDAGGQVWANGTYRIQFNPNGAPPPYQWNGSVFVPGSNVFSGNLNSSGVFSGVSVPSNNYIGPGTLWTFTVCPAATSPCYSTSIPISGATQSVSSNIVPPAIVVPSNAYNQPTAYSDSEIGSPVIGFSYFNLTDQTIHSCTVAVPCTWLSIGGGSSGGTPGGVATNIQFKVNSSTFGGIPGSTADGTNGLMTLAPSGTGVALTITGDSHGSDIQQWKVNGGGGTFGVNDGGTITGLNLIGTGNITAQSGTLTAGKSGTAGSIVVYNNTATTTWASAATTSNTIKGPATVPATTDLLSCSTSSTTCTLTDTSIPATAAGILAACTGCAPLVSPSFTTPSLGAATATSLVATGIVDGTAPLNNTSTTPCTLGATSSNCGSLNFSTGYTFNDHGTTAQAIVYNLPTAAAGLQYCVANGDHSRTPNTGTIEIATSASGQYIYQLSSGTFSASGGYIISGGAAGDAACVIGTGANDWYFYSQQGTWTIH